MIKVTEGLVHCIARCDDCDWEDQDYLTANNAAYKHAREHKHTVRAELAIHKIFYGGQQDEG